MENLVKVRYPGHCRSCRRPLGTGTRARQDTLGLTCETCVRGEADARRGGSVGTPGESLRRRGALGRLLPGKDVTAERQVARALEEARERGCAVLHDQELRNGGRASHLVVSEEGVHVFTDARVPGELLLLGGSLRTRSGDVSPLLATAHATATQVRAALHSVGVDVPVHPVLVLVGTELSFEAREVQGVVVTGPKQAAAQVGAGGGAPGLAKRLQAALAMP